MGSIVVQKAEFLGQVGERIGYKSGLALTIEEFENLMRNEENLVGLFQAPFDVPIRIRSEVYEELFAILLHKVGVTPEIERGFMISAASNPAHREMAVEVGPYFTEFLNDVTSGEVPAEGYDPTLFIRTVRENLGLLGAEVALDMISRLDRHVNNSPWSPSREIDWADTRPLDELFASEKLDSLHGDYFDQRFVNFIHSNFARIGEINWRQFEGLAAQYLESEGYVVEVGPGRDDGNIDIRCWGKEISPGKPPTMLVQCKRQKDDVGKVVVKALWADMQEENAESGLIVTTSRIAPGAKDVITARDYKIDEANRSTLREWVAAMRTPGRGIYMGE